MTRPCDHKETPDPDNCHVCWLYVNDPKYRAAFDALPALHPGDPTVVHPTPVGPPKKRDLGKRGCGGCGKKNRKIK